MTKDLSLHDETHLKVLRLLESTPHINQSKLAESLGVSPGKTKFCMNDLLNKVPGQDGEFSNYHKKTKLCLFAHAARHCLKSSPPKSFLRRKMKKYEALKAKEIEQLNQEASCN